MVLRSVNPATGKELATYEEHTEAQVEASLARAEAAFCAWRGTSFSERAGLLRALARLLRGRKERYSRLITEEMGKTIASAEAEIEKCALICEYYADSGAGFLTQEPVETDADESFVRFDPIGVVFAVMPWNMPFWMPMRSAAPAVMAGNVFLLKHASNICGCSLALEEAFVDAGLPPGVFQSLLIGSPRVGAVLADRRVRAVTLTGSEATGRAIAEQAGRHIKKCVLELGGCDPFVVFPDAEIDRAADAGLTGRIFLAGQACIAAKRFIVHQAVADEFSTKLHARMAALKMGDPLDRGNDIGPLAREDLLLELDKQVQDSVKLGARCLLGGRRADRPGSFYEPTMLVDVRKGMPAYDEEVFGPVASVVVAEDDQDALRLANDTSYGLGASLWTRDVRRGKELANRIEAGMVFINGFTKSDHRLPFGGVKCSGYGRECGRYGMLEFVNIKTVWASNPAT